MKYIHVCIMIEGGKKGGSERSRKMERLRGRRKVVRERGREGEEREVKRGREEGEESRSGKRERGGSRGKEAEKKYPPLGHLSPSLSTMNTSAVDTLPRNTFPPDSCSGTYKLAPKLSSLSMRPSSRTNTPNSASVSPASILVLMLSSGVGNGP